MAKVLLDAPHIASNFPLHILDDQDSDSLSLAFMGFLEFYDQFANSFPFFFSL